MSTEPEKTTANEDAPPEQSVDQGEELPAPTQSTPGKAVFPRLTGGKRRRNAIRLLLPRDPEALKNLPKAVRGILVLILDEVCGEPSIDQFEILMYNGPIGLEIILHPRPLTVDGRAMQQTRLDLFIDQVHSPALSKTVEAVKRHLPKRMDAEVGTLDLSPVGVSDVTTTRLFVTEDAKISHDGGLDISPLTAVFKSTQTYNIPFLYQVLLDKSKNTYNLSARLATYRPEHTYSGRRGLAKLAEQGHPLDLSRPFEAYNVTTNHKGMTHKHWNTEYTKRIDGRDQFTASYSYEQVSAYKPRSEVRREARKVKEIVLGKTEHRRLLNGNASWDPICKNSLNRYGRFEATPAQLKPFVEVVPLEWTTNPWKLLSGRSAPTFNTHEVITTSGMTAASLGEGTVNLPEDTEGVANEGSVQHQSLGMFVTRTLTEGGDEAEEVEQTSESVPDCLLYPDDQYLQTLDCPVTSDIVNGEFESKTPSKPSKTLVNADRANVMDRHVLFVYENEKTARRGYKHLRSSFNKALETGLQPYNRTDLVRCPDGRVPIVEGDVSTTWQLAGTESLAASADGRVLASGPADTDVGTFDWDCRFYREVDGIHRVETEDGECIAEYRSNDAFTAEWTRVKQPHLPTTPDYLACSTIAYRDEEHNELRLYEPDESLRAAWDQPDTEGKMDRHRNAMAAFCEERLIHDDNDDDGGHVIYEGLQTAFQAWYDHRSEHEPPSNSVIGQVLPEDLKEAKTGGTDNTYKYFDGWRWAIPRDLDSPHHPDPDTIEESDPATDTDTDEDAASAPPQSTIDDREDTSRNADRSTNGSQQ
ncbi:hypothetical protein PNP85_11385 [Halobacterium salinarum]|uniref:hypothetical protein n=1 Tax=Halobacterium salinarum TaxID=2242 RepID=UPI0025526ADF|nr:hypothetical protein [Halobacterium salinarum]MDL0140106.1 hypothetical protein [Halobacterium salinarum]